MSFKLATTRLEALKRAELAAKNPEFKTLWANKRQELIELLQSGSSYDELSGELI
tara:strand:- start:1903 stop:2067 length:165 start_codon:yes stop_codon:yes gene_type:complete